MMATTKGPGKAFRAGSSLRNLMAMCPTDDTAREWFEAHMWPNGPYCPRCGSFNVQCGIRHKTMTHRCRECEGKPRFSLKTGNVMEGSKLGCQTWAVALNLAMAGVEGVSSMKLHRRLGDHAEERVASYPPHPQDARRWRGSDVPRPC